MKSRFCALLHEKRFQSGMTILAGIYITVIGVLSSVPPVSRDALIQHLALPKLYLQHGGIFELPQMVVSYYPQLLDFIYCIPLYFQSDIACKYIHFMFALATAYLLYLYLKKRLSSAYGWLGAFFFLTIPIIIKLSITVYVDLGLVFFTTAALYLLVEKWVSAGFGWKHLCLAGLCAGLGAGTKYNGLIVILLLTLLLPLLLPKVQRQSWKAVIFPACFFCFSMAVFSPWMIRNYIWTGNPVYPLAQNRFNARTVQDDSAKTEPAGPTHLLFRKYLYQETAWETMSIPLRIFFQGEDNNPQYFDGVLNPFLLLLPVLGVFGIKKSNRQAMVLWLAFSFLLILIVFFKTDMRIRYVTPALPGLVVLSVFGLYHLKTILLPAIFKSQKAVNILFGLSLVMIFTFNIKYLFEQFSYVNPIAYLSGDLSRDQYILRYRPEYPVIKAVNRLVRPGEMVLAMFLGDRRYYFDCEVRFAREKFMQYVKGVSTSEALSEMIRQQGFSHVIVRHDLFDKWVEDDFSPEKQLLVRNFFLHQTVLIKRSQSYSAYAIF